MTLFEDRAVAFLDILGFKNLIISAESGDNAALNRLINLRTTLDSHVRWDNDLLDSNVPPASKPQYLFVSDSVIISSPLGDRKYDGLAIVITKAVQLCHKLLEQGFLLRGGIAVGKAWHDERNIFGSGYVDAYITCEQRAQQPRLLLTGGAVLHLMHATRPSGEHWAEFLPFQLDGNDVILDTLAAEYSRVAGMLPIETSFMQYQAHIRSSLRTLPHGTDGHSKWRWMAKYFNRSIKKQQLNVPPIDLHNP